MSRIAELRETLGGMHPVAATKVKDHLEPYVRAYIENSPFVVMASASSNGDCDASPKGGLPGFIKVIDDRTLLIPDFGGNRLFQSYENFESNPKVGLVFMIPGMEVTARVNGRIRLAEAAELEAQGITSQVHKVDENSGLIQGIILSIDEAYFHCPRAFKFANLWDAQTIATNAERSLKSLKKD